MEAQDLRRAILDYAQAQYNASPEYLWERYPTFAVLRHERNRKWFALVGRVPRSALGLEGAEVEILNIKCGPALTGALLGQPGCRPAYHMNKTHWVTVLLDGTVPLEDILPLLELSFQATAGSIRPPKGRK